MTTDELMERGRKLITQFDDEGISDADQVSIFGGVMAAALLQLPREERIKRYNAHMVTLRSML